MCGVGLCLSPCDACPEALAGRTGVTTVMCTQCNVAFLPEQLPGSRGRSTGAVPRTAQASNMACAAGQLVEGDTVIRALRISCLRTWSCLSWRLQKLAL